MTITPKRLAILTIAGEIFSINRVYDWDTLTYTDNLTMDEALEQAEGLWNEKFGKLYEPFNITEARYKAQNVINNISIHFEPQSIPV